MDIIYMSTITESSHLWSLRILWNWHRAWTCWLPKLLRVSPSASLDKKINYEILVINLNLIETISHYVKINKHF